MRDGLKVMLKYVGLVLLTLVAACTHKIKDLDGYSKAPLLMAEYVSSDEMRSSKVKVAIIEFDNGALKEAEKAELGKTIASKIENVLASNKLVTIAERDNVLRLKQEIALAEMQGDSSYSGPVLADYAVTGKIVSAGLEHKFQSSSSYYNPASGTYVRVPAKNKYEATVSGNFKILKLPSLDVVNVVEFKGEEYRFEDAIENRGFFSTKIDSSNIKAEDNELLRKAALDAIEDNAYKLKNIFAELKRGYVYEKRSHGKQVIFLVGMGVDDGIKLGAKLDLYTIALYHDPIEGKDNLEEVKIGQVIVTNQVFNNRAWVVVKDGKLVEKIRSGDFVKMKYSKSLANQIDSIADKTKGLLY
jgi:hypothetical protein